MDQPLLEEIDSDGPRVRITFEVPPDLAARARAAAAEDCQSLAGFCRAALIEQLEKKDDQAEMDQLAPTAEREKPAQAQARFLLAVERHFFVSEACRLSGIGRDQVRKWLAKPAFEERFCEAQECFIEWVESKLLRMGLGRIKGSVVALMAWLNAHHPEYGRIKVEMLSKVLGPIIERFYDVARKLAGDQLGETLARELREIAEKKMAEYSQ